MSEDRVADLDLALSAAHAAGETVMRSFRTDPEVRHKGPDQPVTDADLEADRLLADRLMGARPSYGWLSEETVDGPARLERTRTWVVDPIDGTRSFIAGYREFAVSVGLAEDGEATVGVVYNPAMREVFWAIRGTGAYRIRGWTGGREGTERLELADPARGERHTLLASRSEIAAGELEPFEAEWRIRPVGSTAYKLACLAGGLGHAFVSRGAKSEWDVAAGALIVTEAGGRVTDLRGADLRYNRPDPYVHGIVAGTPAVQPALRAAAGTLPAERLRAAPD